MRVLIIDDHKGFRDELRRMLAQHGHEIDDAPSASEAMQPAETGNYDIILLDYQMPEHDGLWFMRTAHIPRHTKVLLVTNHAHPTLINEMIRAGCAGYIIKPFDEDDLVRHLDFHAVRHAPSAGRPESRSRRVRVRAAGNKGSTDGATEEDCLRCGSMKEAGIPKSDLL